MSVPSSSLRLFRRFTVQASYPARFRYYDYVGTLAELFADEFDEVDFDSDLGGIQFENDDDSTLTIGATETVLDLSGDAAWDCADRFSAVWHEVAQVLEPPHIDRLGVRSLSVFLMDSAEEAVRKFRGTFGDYQAKPLEGLGGKPTRVSFSMDAAGIISSGPRPVDASLRLLPIYVTSRVAEDLGVDPRVFGGGWMFDLDVSFPSGSQVPATDVSEGLQELKHASETVIQRICGNLEEKTDAIGA